MQPDNMPTIDLPVRLYVSGEHHICGESWVGYRADPLKL